MGEYPALHGKCPQEFTAVHIKEAKPPALTPTPGFANHEALKPDPGCQPPPLPSWSEPFRPCWCCLLLEVQQHNDAKTLKTEELRVEGVR